MGEPEQNVRLSNEQLSKLVKDVQTPVYDRAALRQHTVHIGVGAFHRAHQAVYLDDLLHMPGEPRWGECGLGVLPGDRGMRDALEPQDYLYTVVEKSAEAQKARVIGSITGYILAPAARALAIETLAAPDTRIVSLTITEGGYFIDEGTRAFTAGHPDIQHDLAHPDAPVTSIGFIAAALDRRRVQGLPPFTLMSCDNLQGNGDVLKSVMLAYASLRNPELEQWIAANVAFPNSMVDRITPATTPEDGTALKARYGFDDAWPVMTESFKQWVIEDHFPQGRPAWEKAGAELVTDVAPYELMKMRLLNGSHLAMAYLGALTGTTYVHQVMHDSLFVTFIQQFMEEVTPVVPVIPGTDVVQYKKTLIERFANPGIHDQVTRICSEGSAKMPKWVLPSIVELLAKGRPVPLLSLVIASWLHYFQAKTDERGHPLDIVDARAAELRATATAGGTNPRTMLAIRSIFGEALPANQTFVHQVEQALITLNKQDAKTTIRQYLSGKTA